MKRSVFFFALMFLAMGASAEVEVNHLFGNGMVLQREAPINVWGTALPGESVSVSFGQKKMTTLTTTADASGHWLVSLPAQKAGGPYTLRINDQTLSDILVGDVLLCTGQSNMELQVSRVMDTYADEVTGYENDQLRYLKLPYHYDFSTPQTDIAPAAWHPMTTAYVQNMAALCYFIARLLNEQTHVPVGIVNSSWGGSAIEAWMSLDALNAYPKYLNKRAIYTSPEYVSALQQTEREASERWNAVMHNADPGLTADTPWYAPDADDSSWQEVDMFSKDWATERQHAVSGSHWFRQTVSVPAAWTDKDALLRLGCIVDADSVWVNGQYVGGVTYQYPPRKYPLPAGLLHEGDNQLTVRLTTGGRGSFVKDKPYKIICGQEEISLATTWRHHVGAVMPPSAPTTAWNNIPTGLYNGMLAPLEGLTTCGVVWYQGETNAGDWDVYADLLVDMIKDWRRTLHNDTLPFYIVELADFLAPDDPGRHAWGKLREAQREAATRTPNTHIIKNSDTGEWNDIHPQDKKTAATRIVEAILSSTPQ